LKFHIAAIGIFYLFCSCDLDLDPMTFIYDRDPYSLDIYQICDVELPLSRLLKVIVWQTYIQTRPL